jgi:hypothetical protein
VVVAGHASKTRAAGNPMTAQYPCRTEYLTDEEMRELDRDLLSIRSNEQARFSLMQICEEPRRPKVRKNNPTDAEYRTFLSTVMAISCVVKALPPVDGPNPERNRKKRVSSILKKISRLQQKVSVYPYITDVALSDPASVYSENLEDTLHRAYEPLNGRAPAPICDAYLAVGRELHSLQMLYEDYISARRVEGLG